MKILLIEDQLIFRNGLKNALKCLANGIEFTEVNNCEKALQCLDETSFDLVITELALLDSSEMDTLNQLRNRIASTPIVVLCGENSPQIMHATISERRPGFTAKSSNDNFLLSVIQFFNNGGIYFPPNGPDRWDNSAVDKNKETPIDLIFPGLSKRQLEVLANVVQGKPNKVIAREMNIAEGTVKFHLSQLFRVLGVKNRTEAVYAATKLRNSVR